MDCYSGEFGDVLEGTRGGEKVEGVAATGATEGTVFVVRGGVIPGTETGLFRCWLIAVRKVFIGEGEEVGGKSVVVVIVKSCFFCFGGGGGGMLALGGGEKKRKGRPT